MNRLLVVALAIFISLTSPTNGRAQEGTATPVPGYVDGAQRQFKASGLRLIGIASLNAAVFQLDSEDHAAEAFPNVVDHLKKNLESNGIGNWQQASAPKIGDERIAYAGTAKTTIGDEPATLQVGLFAWRDDNFVLIMVGVGLSGDMLPDLFTTAKAIEGRTPGPKGSSPETPSQTMLAGGIWDVLPTLDDIPAGLVFAEDSVPGQGATATPSS